jgi:hypothetical protein
MARICARCRQPLDPSERPDDHLCLDDYDGDPDEGGKDLRDALPGNSVPDFYRQEVPADAPICMDPWLMEDASDR